MATLEIDPVELFDTSDGDAIRVECPRSGQSFSDGVALTVCDDPAADVVDGVITSSAHGDTVHRLFARGEPVRITVRPAGAADERTYDECTLLSSSGKWISSRL